MARAELTQELIEFLQNQKDRQEITDCLLRYCRGIDRHDKELMASAYHPDAVDQHGFTTAVSDVFCEKAINMHAEIQTNHQHGISNVSLDIDGDMAHGETYFYFWGENLQGPPLIAFGRYIDRFEKRDGKWAIAYRVCITEKSGYFLSSNNLPEVEKLSKSTGPSEWNKSDLSYARPLSPDDVKPRM